jgi:transposase IS116/IS110/IS902 family protein
VRPEQGQRGTQAEGRPPRIWAVEPVLISGRPFDLSGCACRARIRRCRVAPAPRSATFGLGPRVRRSGEKAARHGHISRAGQAHARGLLVDAAHTAIRTPGPLRAFHARLAARRGTQVALCATARKLAVLAWHLLTKDEDYRYGRADDHPAQAAHAPAQSRRPRPEGQPRRRDQAQDPPATLPRRGRAQLPQLPRVQGAERRGRRQWGHDRNGRQGGRRCAAGSTVPRRLLFSFGVTRAGKDSCTQPLTFSCVCTPRSSRPTRAVSRSVTTR